MKGHCDYCGGPTRGLFEEMEAALTSVMRLSYLDDDVINRHAMTTTSCEALKQVRDVLAKIEVWRKST